ncbi:tyrosine-type recombinase/integrase [Thermodesulfobacteriota bacterium]
MEKAMRFEVSDKDIRMLAGAILDYLYQIKSDTEYSARLNVGRFTEILTDFLIYTIRQGVALKDMFTFDTFIKFRKSTGVKKVAHALIGLSGYLHDKGSIPAPLQIPNYQIQLPDIYEQYLCHLKQNKAVSEGLLKGARRVLAVFHDHLGADKIDLCALKIEHLDLFMAKFKVALSTRKTYRHYLRGFLKYLYYEKKILRKNLAPLLVGAPRFDQVKPPKFLRPREVQKLFTGLKLSTPTDVRTCAMVYLAYTLGLRPIEISKITLDDISFSEGKLRVPDRKTKSPVVLPLPEMTIKALAAYIATARPEAPLRQLFLTNQKPIKPVSANTVVYYIGKAMKDAGLSSSAYWLRHTYAQNLLQIGRSIYEIKEMLGHQNIQSSQVYLHIDTKLMRKVLFNETL